MNKQLRTAVVAALVVIGATAQSRAQSNIVQMLNVNLIAYDTNNGAAVKVMTKDVIRFFAGSNVAGGQLWLVTPPGNAPGTTGDLNAFLRVTSGNTTVVEVPSPDSFNLFQDSVAVTTTGTKTTEHAINRFSIDFGQFHAELQGFSTWSIMEKNSGGVDLGGSGTFQSTVNGLATIDGVTATEVPIKGTITAGPPKAGP